ncbi:MAG: hypothetical protein IJ366_06795 [Clostridia bacterium]|nr:hypothetical protein [Clostridia bacterium]
MKKELKKIASITLTAAMLASMAIPTMAAEEDFVASEIVTPDVAAENFHVYLCIGQSNMAGRAGFEEEDLMVLDRTYLLTADGQWEKAKPVWNAEIEAYEGLNRNSTVKDEAKYQGLGPAFYMAKTLSENVDDSVSIGIVGNARGNTSVTRWEADNTQEPMFGEEGSKTNLYQEALAQAQAAIAAGGTIKGIIWHQGCANAGTSGYKSRFKGIVEGLRTALGNEELPVFMGEIPGFGNSALQIANRQGFNGEYIKATAEAIDNCYYISSVGLTDGGDTTHFDSASQRELGKRYGEIVLDKVYGQVAAVDNAIAGGSVTATNAANAAAAKDDAADINGAWYVNPDRTGTEEPPISRYLYDETKISKISAFPAEFVIDFKTEVEMSQLDSYFADPYNYVYQYKVYTAGEDKSWTLAADNSAITKYADVAYDGAVTDVLSGNARYVKVEITGAVDTSGTAVTLSDNVTLGVNELAVRGESDLIWSEDFEAYEAGSFTASGDIAYSKKSTNGTLTIEEDSASKVIKLAKPNESGKDYLRFAYTKTVADLNTYTVNFRMKVAEGAVTYAFNEGQAEAQGASLSVSNTSGNIQYYHEVNDKKNQTALAAQWGNWNDYTLVVKRKADTTQNCWDLYINDVLIAADIPLRGSADFGRLEFYLPNSVSGAGAIYVDDITVLASEPAEDVRIITSVDGTSVSSTYPAGKMNIIAAPTAPATKKDYVVIAAEYDLSGKLLNLRVMPIEAGTNKVTQNMTVVADTTVKFMVWNSMQGMTPFKGAKTMTYSE